jgi:hypothetical protein
MQKLMRKLKSSVSTLHYQIRRKVLEELANKIKDQWIRETQELINNYKSIKILKRV